MKFEQAIKILAQDKDYLSMMIRDDIKEAIVRVCSESQYSVFSEEEIALIIDDATGSAKADLGVY